MAHKNELLTFSIAENEPEQIFKTDRKSKIVGLVMNLLAALSIGTSGAIVQRSGLGGDFATFGIGTMGFLAGIIGFLATNKTPISLTQLFKVFANGFFCGGMLNFLFFEALDFISVGDATAVSYFSAFVFSLILESIITKKMPHWSIATSSLIGLAGLVCISQSEANLSDKLSWSQMIGVLLTTACGFSGSLFYLNMQKWPNVNGSLLVSASFIGCLVFPLPSIIQKDFSLDSGSIPNRLLALFGYTCYVFTAFLAICGSKLSNPSLGFFVRTLSISFCYILQIFWLNRQPKLLSSVGSGLISFSIISQSLFAIWKAPQNEKEEDLERETAEKLTRDSLEETKN